MTNSRISIERNEGRIELKTLKTDEWTFLEKEPRYAVSVLDEEEARSLLQQLVAAIAHPPSDQLEPDESKDVHLLVNLSTGEANLVFSALCFSLQYSGPDTGNRTQLLHIIPKVITAVAAGFPHLEEDMDRWFEETKAAMSQNV